MKKEEADIRIVDIARLAEVSAGTVDRVIHNRGKVSPANRLRIEKIIHETGYAPNLSARALASRRKYPIAVVAPHYDGSGYWSMVGEGIQKAADEMKRHNLSTDFFRFDQHDRASFPAAEDIFRHTDYKGVIIATLFEEHAKELSARLDERVVPYVYIDSVIAGRNDVAYFGVDALRSGWLAGRLLASETGCDAPILVAHIRFGRDDISLQMRAREQGLLQYLAASRHRGPIDWLEVDPDDGGASLDALKKYLSGSAGPIGAIVLNSRVYELAAMLERLPAELRSGVVVAGFEAIAPNVEAMRRGAISLLISQRPELQGYDAVKALAGVILFGNRPASKVNFMPIDIIVPENVEYYNNYKL
jgi:LacI family transcriptional regulator